LLHYVFLLLQHFLAMYKIFFSHLQMPQHSLDSYLLHIVSLFLCKYMSLFCRPCNSVGIAIDYGLDGDQIPVGARFSARPDRSWGPPSLPYNGYPFFSGGKLRTGRDPDPSPLLAPRSWRSRAITLPPSGPQMGL
jgi:hypothetical protein